MKRAVAEVEARPERQGQALDRVGDAVGADLAHPGMVPDHAVAGVGEHAVVALLVADPEAELEGPVDVVEAADLVVVARIALADVAGRALQAEAGLEAHRPRRAELEPEGQPQVVDAERHVGAELVVVRAEIGGADLHPPARRQHQIRIRGVDDAGPGHQPRLHLRRRPAAPTPRPPRRRAKRVGCGHSGESAAPPRSTLRPKLKETVTLPAQITTQPLTAPRAPRRAAP